MGKTKGGTETEGRNGSDGDRWEVVENMRNRKDRRE